MIRWMHPYPGTTSNFITLKCLSKVNAAAIFILCITAKLVQSAKLKFWSRYRVKISQARSSSADVKATSLTNELFFQLLAEDTGGNMTYAIADQGYGFGKDSSGSNKRSGVGGMKSYGSVMVIVVVIDDGIPGTGVDKNAVHRLLPYRTAS